MERVVAIKVIRFLIRSIDILYQSVNHGISFSLPRQNILHPTNLLDHPL